MTSLNELYRVLEQNKMCSSEEEVDVFAETVNFIVEKGDKESIPILFSYLPIVSKESDFIAEHLLLSFESYPTETFVQVVIEGFDFFYNQSTEFLTGAFFGDYKIT